MKIIIIKNTQNKLKMYKKKRENIMRTTIQNKKKRGKKKKRYFYDIYIGLCFGHIYWICLFQYYSFVHKQKYSFFTLRFVLFRFCRFWYTRNGRYFQEKHCFFYWCMCAVYLVKTFLSSMTNHGKMVKPNVTAIMLVLCAVVFICAYNSM